MEFSKKTNVAHRLIGGVLCMVWMYGGVGAVQAEAWVSAIACLILAPIFSCAYS